MYSKPKELWESSRWQLRQPDPKTGGDPCAWQGRWLHAQARQEPTRELKNCYWALIRKQSRGKGERLQNWKENDKEREWQRLLEQGGTKAGVQSLHRVPGDGRRGAKPHGSGGPVCKSAIELEKLRVTGSRSDTGACASGRRSGRRPKRQHEGISRAPGTVPRLSLRSKLIPGASGHPCGPSSG